MGMAVTDQEELSSWDEPESTALVRRSGRVIEQAATPRTGAPARQR
jgi:hypothetical protein